MNSNPAYESSNESISTELVRWKGRATADNGETEPLSGEEDDEVPTAEQRANRRSSILVVNMWNDFDGRKRPGKVIITSFFERLIYIFRIMLL